MKLLHDNKNIVLKLFILASLIFYCVVYSSEVSLPINSSSGPSTDISSRKWSLPSLKFVSDIEPEKSAPTSKKLATSSLSSSSSSGSSGLHRALSDGDDDTEPYLESDDDSWISGTPTEESISINKDRQTWWKYISEADSKAYLAEQANDLANQKLYADLARILRNHVKTVEDSRPARTNDIRITHRVPLPGKLATWRTQEPQEPVEQEQGTTVEK